MTVGLSHRDFFICKGGIKAFGCQHLSPSGEIPAACGGDAQLDNCSRGDENERAPCSIPVLLGSSLAQRVPCVTRVPRCRCDGDAAQREIALQKAGGLGTDVPFRAKDMEKAGVLSLKWVMTVTWKQTCVPQ